MDSRGHVGASGHDARGPEMVVIVSDNVPATTTTKPIPDDARARVVSHGIGNHRNVTVTRLRFDVVGMVAEIIGAIRAASPNGMVADVEIASWGNHAADRLSGSTKPDNPLRTVLLAAATTWVASRVANDADPSHPTYATAYAKRHVYDRDVFNACGWSADVSDARRIARCPANPPADTPSGSVGVMVYPDGRITTDSADGLAVRSAWVAAMDADKPTA